tara:strand:+ start:507 stop:1094 length:588 start_codon:yes stop_codon:yes gene_type:complete
MRVFITVLVLIFSFQSWTKADDIRDFEIEGISVGDSALDFFTKNEINEAPISGTYNSDKFFDKEILHHESFSKFEGIQMTFKKNDNQFIVYALSGYNFYRENVDECFKQVDNVANEISNLFKNVKGKSVYKSHEGDPTGKSKTKSVDYWFKSGVIAVECWNWSDEITEKKRWVDSFGVTIYTNEHVDWLNNEAYK